MQNKIKERPILFSPEMISAILGGQKTMTRRIVNPQPEANRQTGIDWFQRRRDGCWVEYTDEQLLQRCPYGSSGDRLWVRESHWKSDRDPNTVVFSDGYVKDRDEIVTGETVDVDSIRSDPFFKKRPSMFLPRWASRILLSVESVRIERLHEISEIDAKAEGVASVFDFRELWDRLNGRGPFPWRSNPWVWVVVFLVVSSPGMEEC